MNPCQSSQVPDFFSRSNLENSPLLFLTLVVVVVGASSSCAAAVVLPVELRVRK